VTDAERKREALGGHFLFQGLSEAELDLLAQRAVRRRVPARCELFRKGDESLEAYAILAGRLKATSSSPEGREITLSIMGPGELVGEVAMLCGGKRTLTVETLEPSELLVLQRRDLVPLLERHPAAGLAMMAALAERLGQLTELFEDAALRGVPARLARQLLALADVHGEAQDGLLRIDLKLSQSELGRLVGASRESVNKQMKAWERDGLVVLDAGHVAIRDRDALEEIAERFTR
jgi:CRP-like cAMP-binding protein